MMEWSDNGIVIEIFLQIKGAKHKRCQNKSTAKYRHRLHVPHTTVYITHPWGDFPSSIARQPRGCHQDRTIRLRDALGKMFPTPDLFWHGHYFYIPTVEISTTEKLAQGGMIYIYTPSYTVCRVSGLGLVGGGAEPTNRENRGEGKGGDGLGPQTTGLSRAPRGISRVHGSSYRAKGVAHENTAFHLHRGPAPCSGLRVPCCASILLRCLLRHLFVPCSERRPAKSGKRSKADQRQGKDANGRRKSTQPFGVEPETPRAVNLKHKQFTTSVEIGNPPQLRS